MIARIKMNDIEKRLQGVVGKNQRCRHGHAMQWGKQRPYNHKGASRTTAGWAHARCPSDSQSTGLVMISEQMKAVFIGGVERSGTTMLGAMLGAHGHHICVPEMASKMDILRAEGRPGDSRTSLLQMAIDSPKNKLQGWNPSAG